MAEQLIYLDNAATSWPKPDCVGEAMVDFLTHKAGNPGRGGHRLAREASQVLEEIRERLSKLVNSPCPQRMILSHGCTDALNLAIHGVLRADMRQRCDGTKPHVVTTAIEHNAVLRTLHCYATSDLITMTIVPCDEQGYVHADKLIDACTDCTVLMTLSHASNVLGTIQPVEETIKAVRSHNPEILIMVDAAQTAGHFPIDVQGWDIDLLPLAGHKGLRGPTGTGGLYVSPRAYPDECDKTRVFCQRRGGTGSMAPGLEMPTKLPDALEAGTSNAVGFAGLIAAIDALTHEVHEHEMAMTDRVLKGLHEIPYVTIYGLPTIEGRTPVVLFNVEGMHPREVMTKLDAEHGIAVRGGVHCAPLLHEAIGTGSDGGVRVSPGSGTSAEQIDIFLDAIRAMAPQHA
ncbi:MAG: aminotransferase class V-fold PLP-dependent enzyme [Phycisphaerales bacterium JB052]